MRVGWNFMVIANVYKGNIRLHLCATPVSKAPPKKEPNAVTTRRTVAQESIFSQNKHQELFLYCFHCNIFFCRNTNEDVDGLTSQDACRPVFSKVVSCRRILVIWSDKHFLPFQARTKKLACFTQRTWLVQEIIVNFVRRSVNKIRLGKNESEMQDCGPKSSQMCTLFLSQSHILANWLIPHWRPDASLFIVL